MKKLILLLALMTLTACAGAALAENALPPYAYPGTDPVEAAVTAYMIDSGLAWADSRETESVMIPAPVILRTEYPDETHMKVYGNFWHFNYTLDGTVLRTISGGEAPGILTFELKDGVWTGIEADIAGDGDDYPEDIRRFSNGDAELEARFFAAGDGMRDPVESVLRRFIREYAEANGLEITAYQDPYWPPVELADKPEAQTLTGELADGKYVIRVPVAADDAGEWRAEAVDGCVTLSDAHLEDGVFQATFAPASDGTATVYLRHYTGIACDQAHSFDLLVAGGEIKESIGGSYTTSPAEEDLDPFLSGVWMEQDTQFTNMCLFQNPKGGWDAEITSPLTHGSYVFQATVYYDCDLDMLVYANGTYCDLPTTAEGTADLGEPVKSGLTGSFSLKLDETASVLSLLWNSGMEDIGNIVFVR